MRALNRLLAGATTVLLVVGWLMLAPTSLGGSTTYVTTHGISMEPGFQAGDLALIRAADEYAVGDAVAYHSDQLDTTVLHRIVAVDNGRFTLRGDNNSWLDADRPTADQIVGALALRIPQGGVWLDRLTGPPALALIVFGIALAGGATAHTRRTKRRRNVSSHANRSARTPSLTALPPQLVPVAYGTAVAGLVGVVLGFLAWTGPTTEAVTAEVESDRTVTFSYTAQVPPTAAYDGTTVSSPEPVFRKLAQDVEVAYAYRGEPGTVSVSAELAAANGWRMNVPLAPETSFTGDEYDASVDLDLSALEQRTKRAADAIGVPMDQVTVMVQPRFVDETGAVFEPELPLSLSPTTLTLPDPAALKVTDTTTTTSQTAGARELSLMGRSIAVDTARTISLVLLAAALLAGLLLPLLGRSMRTATEGAAIRQRYASMLVRVQPMPVPPGRPVVDVTEMATLVKLAERYGLLVLHWSRAEVETFVVQDEGTTYRYRAGAGAGTAPGDPESATGLVEQEV